MDEDLRCRQTVFTVDKRVSRQEKFAEMDSHKHKGTIRTPVPLPSTDRKIRNRAISKTYDKTL